MMSVIGEERRESDRDTPWGCKDHRTVMDFELDLADDLRVRENTGGSFDRNYC